MTMNDIFKRFTRPKFSRRATLRILSDAKLGKYSLRGNMINKLRFKKLKKGDIVAEDLLQILDELYRA